MAELFFALYFIKAFVQSEELKTIFQGGETDIKARKGPLNGRSMLTT